MVEFKTMKQNFNFDDVLDIHPTELAEVADQVQIIDVRQPEEYTNELGHIQNSELIVLGTLEHNLERLSKTKPVVFVCRSGARSARASAFAKENGFSKVYNLEGGMILWNELGLPISK